MNIVNILDSLFTIFFIGCLFIDMMLFLFTVADMSEYELKMVIAQNRHKWPKPLVAEIDWYNDCIKSTGGFIFKKSDWQDFYDKL